jgi:hypothetical protein
MPHIFSYGTLQEQSVQRSTFGRVLEGHPDRLVGYERVSLTLTDKGLIAAMGRALLANLHHEGGSAAHVDGACLSLTEAELVQCDRYEWLARYTRQLVTLESGKQAWVYTSCGQSDR